ncbi:hypothetical protein [Streptomyces buecherae]|uniref:Collagen-like protein n=1 Tax=Streptomyces buecherae TaxID=2763006 RepID=A0A7H8NBY9_9ACTN|nr:hypothetical protein [Streptomyces buecherae]QKW52017.1 hypothetical protein HUT08_23615 [Streptomyces buecherae]
MSASRRTALLLCALGGFLALASVLAGQAHANGSQDGGREARADRSASQGERAAKGARTTPAGPARTATTTGKDTAVHGPRAAGKVKAKGNAGAAPHATATKATPGGQHGGRQAAGDREAGKANAQHGPGRPDQAKSRSGAKGKGDKNAHAPAKKAHAATENAHAKAEQTPREAAHATSGGKASGGRGEAHGDGPGTPHGGKGKEHGKGEGRGGDAGGPGGHGEGPGEGGQGRPGADLPPPARLLPAAPDALGPQTGPRTPDTPAHAGPRVPHTPANPEPPGRSERPNRPYEPGTSPVPTPSERPAPSDCAGDGADCARPGRGEGPGRERSADTPPRGEGPLARHGAASALVGPPSGPFGVVRTALTAASATGAERAHSAAPDCGTGNRPHGAPGCGGHQHAPQAPCGSPGPIGPTAPGGQGGCGHGGDQTTKRALDKHDLPATAAPHPPRTADGRPRDTASPLHTRPHDVVEHPG